MIDRVELQASVPPEMHGNRLDQVAAQLFPQYSRSRLQDWIKTGAVSVDGQQCRPRDKVSEGACVQVNALLEAEVAWQGQDIALDIPIETAGKRGYRMAEARYLSEAARLNIAQTAWEVRR